VSRAVNERIGPRAAADILLQYPTKPASHYGRSARPPVLSVVDGHHTRKTMRDFLGSKMASPLWTDSKPSLALEP
jgi:hypothetical protein